MINIYNEVLTSKVPDAHQTYDVVITKNNNGIIGKYDNIEVIKFLRLSENKWIVGSSSALPVNVSIARGYINAMVQALEALKKVIDIKSVPSKKSETKTIKETLVDGELVKITGMINGIEAVIARKTNEKWFFDIEKKGADYTWMVELYELTLKMKEIIKKNK